MKKNKVLICGAGPIGSLLGITLTQLGYQVTIYEKRPDSRLSGTHSGRSINLALSDRGIRALAEAGVSETILQAAIPMAGRCIHNPDGTGSIQPYGAGGQHIYSISRQQINGMLLQFAEQSGITIRFEQRCKEMDLESGCLVLEGPSGARNLDFGDLLFGADGSHSSSRLNHMLNHPCFDYQQKYIDYSYKELHLQIRSGCGTKLSQNALHIWPRKDFMLIALPDPGDAFTCTLFLPTIGQNSFETINTSDQVEKFFRANFADLDPYLPDLIRQYNAQPTSRLFTVKCFPWIHKNNFSLIGDASHAILPFFGQGMNAGLEDCSVLRRLILLHDHDWSVILPEFQRLRKEDTDAIADLAYNNFIEMRERTADPLFLLQKKIEARLHSRYPDKWIPAYTQVTFRPDIRYSEALRKSNMQENIMREIMCLPDIESVWADPAIEALILEKLAKITGPFAGPLLATPHG